MVIYQTPVTSIRHDKMIQNLYSKNISRFNQLFCYLDIIFTWNQLPGWVIVTYDDCNRICQDSAFKDIPWCRGGCGNGTNADGLNTDQVIFNSEHNR